VGVGTFLEVEIKMVKGITPTNLGKNVARVQGFARKVHRKRGVMCRSKGSKTNQEINDPTLHFDLLPP